MSDCRCDWATGECQAPLGCKAIAEIEKLRNQLVRARSALEAAREIVEGSEPERPALRVIEQIDAALSDETGK